MNQRLITGSTMAALLLGSGADAKEVSAVATHSLSADGASATRETQASMAQQQPTYIVRRGRGRKTIERTPEMQARYEQVMTALRPVPQLRTRARALLLASDLAGAERTAQEMIAVAKGLSPLPVEEGHHLIGEIRMRQGRYAEALPLLQFGWAPKKDTAQDLAVALCYLHLGDVRMAKQFYSDNAILQYSLGQEDLPGTRTTQSLKASILMARGLDAFFSSRKKEALLTLEAAGKLAPRNGAISFYAGMSLIHMDRRAEAQPYFRRAVEYGSSSIARLARSKVFSSSATPQTQRSQKKESLP